MKKMEKINYNTDKEMKFLNSKIIKEAVLRIGAILVIAGLSWVGIWAVIETIAYYNDTETGSGSFSAGELDFFVDPRKQDNRFQTHTQGGWGDPAHGHNPGAYRDAKFALAFPHGAMIGIVGIEGGDEHSALFTSAGAVENFLPAGGTPKSLDFDYTDPVVTEAGVLAGQVLALTLNVGFDIYDPNFAPSENNLKDYVVNDPSLICNGMTAQGVLDEANNVLGGLSSSFSPSEISDCANWINNKFENGGNSISQFATIIKTNSESLDFQYTVHVEKTSGNDDFCNALSLDALLEGTSYYSGNLLDFVSSLIIYSSSTDEWEFIISLPEDSDSEDSCSFDFVFSGWQTNLPLFGGFSDIERVDDPIYGFTHVSVQSQEPVAEEPVIEEPVIEEPVVEPEMTIIDGLFLAAPLNPIENQELGIMNQESDEILTEDQTEPEELEETETEEEPLIEEEEPIVEPEPAVEEAPIVEEAPAIEQAPVDAPDNPADIGGDTGTDSGDSGESAGGETGDVSAGEAVSE